MTTRVKICGIRSIEDAELCAELGADYLGLNFYRPSPRYVELALAKKIARRVEGDCRIVAVVANASQDRVSEVVDELAPDLVQFHGDESVAQIEPWIERALKVVRVGEGTKAEAPAGFERAWGLLFDSRHDTLLGGSGATWGWEELARVETGKPIFVAGGLGPDNVRRAVETTRPFAVDVCSGVESEPGRKSRKQLERFFEELRLARHST